VPNYLYGDSSPFPGGYDFLAQLKHFVEAATEAMRLASEADELEENLGERAQEHLHGIEALQSFFDSLVGAVGDRAARAGAPQLVAPFAREILEHIEAVSTRARQQRAQHLDADQVDATTQIQERRAALRDVLTRYLLGDPLPVLDWALSLNLGGTSPQGQVLLAHPDELTAAFAVDVASDPTWGRPRKVGEITPGMTMQVGFRRAFLRSSLHPDVQTLDELYLGSLEIGPDSMELHLLRKPDAPREAMRIDLDADDAGRPIAKIIKRDPKSGESEDSFRCQGDELVRVQELASALRREGERLVRRKTRLLFLQLEEHDVFERGLVRKVFERVVDRLAPIAEQVARHSPNPSELSLKLEGDDGRREEIYLRKQELIDRIEPLPPEAQRLFEPLGLAKKRSIPPGVPPLAVPR
jgi:hypothetical protein